MYLFLYLFSIGCVFFKNFLPWGGIWTQASYMHDSYSFGLCIFNLLLILLPKFSRKCTFKQTPSVFELYFTFLVKKGIVHLPSSSSSPWGSHFFKEPYLQAWMIVRIQAQGSLTITIRSYWGRVQKYVSNCTYLCMFQ